MTSTVPIWVAIHENPGIMHWSLFLDTKEAADKTIIQILGARQKYFPSIRTPSNPRDLNSLIELLPLCQIDMSKVESIKGIADATTIHNELADWSCQDYVLELLDRLETAGIISATDEEYAKNKKAVAAKRESWA